MEIYNEIKSWQGAIGSITGFIALILGALFNYRLNRKRDERLRHQEIVSIASALYAEIISLRRSVAQVANAVGNRFIENGMHNSQPIDRHFVEQFKLPKPEIYHGLASKIGILDGNLALEIVSFYSRVAEVETWLPRMQSDSSRPFSYSVNYVLDPAIDAVNKVLTSLHYIEDIAGLKSKADVLDLNKATTAQDIENMQY